MTHGLSNEHFWPDDALDVPGLRAAGVPRLPFREFLLKVHSRCNLACDHCYVYQGADQSWRDQPRAMAWPTAERVCRRIADHAAAHRLPSVRVLLHGGEPLLAGVEFLGRLVRRLRELLPHHTRLDILAQTNGTLVDEAVLRLCHDHGILLGVSMDGDRAVHDRHRARADGGGSHRAVADALTLLGRPEHRPLWAGVLCTVDVTADPAATYRHLMSFAPPAIDLLLPLGHWGSPPPGRTADPRHVPYARWLTTVFDLWYGAPEQTVRLPFFESVLDLLLGGTSRVESVGGGPSRLVVVETDGRLTQSDLLKTAYAGAPDTGCDVFRHGLDELLDHPGIVARQLGRDALAAECRACPVEAVCGGGLYPHRYRPGAGFRNPSVYSPDLKVFIRHVADVVRADLARLSGAGTVR
ncbi:FxsB family cyclophane-forming radical SAM/SPASM peptide maturase [Streptomyces sp. RTd22]|uniref:FxsB family cyclophane-forming radical SAM/SPASM peptide maturase n=1 Tax=Streptomyces sp. RTd22 TaxID=1841249 RepID=UPI000ABFDF87|nr:FxsB family cyclophane-forming radical SAM/SPASM peptide maturase [Streptomyces sp. RTd22]